MRILTVANHLGARGGLERTQLTNCRTLAARGHRVDLVYVSAGDFTDQWRRFAGTMVAVTGTLPRRRRALTALQGLGAAVRTGVRLRPDVLYVYRYWDLPYAVVVGRLAHAPVVLHLCLPPPSTVPRWLRPFLRRVDTVLSVSTDTLGRWRGTGLPVEDATVVLTGIDLEHYRPAGADERHRARHELAWGEEQRVVVYAGRIGREKGVDVLVRAFTLLAAARPDARLVVVGSPSLGADPVDSARYQAELRTLAGTSPVTWMAARSDVLALIQSADVAVAPSLWPEPLSRSVMEPPACGVPVVATRVGGNPEILTGWMADLLVAPHDPEALATRIGEYLDWRRDDPGLGARLRAESETRLSLSREVDAVEALLSGAISAHRRTVSGSSSPGSSSPGSGARGGPAPARTAQPPSRRRNTTSPNEATS